MFVIYYLIVWLGGIILSKGSFGIEVENGKGSNDCTWRTTAT